MSKLIDEFKSEHLAISECLLKAKQAGIRTQEGKNLILSAKQILLEHLDKEDRLLYPVLRQAAESDDHFKKTLTNYAMDMDKISADVITFFGLYESGENTEENFRKDCNEIIKALSKRIIKEEAVLYKQYDKIMSS